MAKRRSVRQLNKDEPDDVDDEPEESGTFEVADRREIAERKIVTAKRRVPPSEGADDRPKPLANFAGFSTAAAGSPFSFFQKLAANTEKPAEATPKPPAAPSTSSGLELLKTLNMSFLNWIKDHLAKDPLVVLIPVFKDYEKHFNCLNLNGPSTSTVSNNDWNFGASAEATKSATVDNALNASKEDKSKLFSFVNPSSKNEKTEAETPKKAASFNFGEKKTQSGFLFSDAKGTSFIKSDVSFGEVKTSAPSFAFGEAKATSAPTFSFGEKKTNSPTFGQNNGATPAPAAAPAFPSFLTNLASAAAGVKQDGGQEGEEESDEPPVSDFVPVGEDGSVFDIRCKLFVKKDGQFNSIGVGKLHLKPLPSGKTQAIARADTAQGSVLLNVILSSDMPLQKTGKNNVLMVCVPTPEAQPPPVPVLIRVKGAEERDQLYSQIDKLRNK